MNAAARTVLRPTVLLFGAVVFVRAFTGSAVAAGLVGGLGLVAVSTAIDLRALRVTMAGAGMALAVTHSAAPVHQRWAQGIAVLFVMAHAGVEPVEPVGTGAFGERFDATLPWLQCLVALGGIYACVPETTEIRPIGWGMAALTMAGAGGLFREPSWARRLPTVAVAVLGWAVLFGGTFRDSALVGGLAVLGFVAARGWLESLATPRRSFVSRTIGPLAVLALQSGYSIAVSRTAGLATTRAHAVALAVPQLVAALVLARLLLGPRRQSAARSDPPPPHPTIR